MEGDTNRSLSHLVRETNSSITKEAGQVLRVGQLQQLCSMRQIQASQFFAGLARASRLPNDDAPQSRQPLLTIARSPRAFVSSKREVCRSEVSMMKVSLSR